MKISFIVPLYNCLPLTQAMLASLRTTLPAGLEHEIIFVDDGSTDGTRAWLATLAAPCRTVLNEKNLGFAGACNRGAATARGEFLFFLNNDLVLGPGWFEPMLAVVSAYADAGLVGNVQLNHATGAVDHTGLTFDAKGKPAHLTARGWSALRPVVAVTGACFAIRAATWRKLGGFDEGFVNGCEDVDLGLRASQAGLTNFVVLHSVVRHHISASLGRKLRDEQNTARLVRRWHPLILSLIPPACARACVAAAWENPRDYVHSRLVREAILYAANLLPHPTRLIQAAAVASLELEAARWAHLLDHAPDRPPQEVAPILFPVFQDGAPVY